ncbi:Pex19 protein, partial [Thamnocephalis sphaerospora]
KPASFQDTITQTMNKLNDSSDKVRSEVDEAEEAPDALMAEMMRQMEQLADSGEFDGLVEGMMGQLMTREVLYEPMKELAEKYPGYLAENKSTLPADDYARYEKQYSYVKQIVAHFAAQPEPATSDADAPAKDDPVIAELMEKMQDCGQPPKEVLQQLAPEMEFGEDGTPNPPDPEQCTIM